MPSKRRPKRSDKPIRGVIVRQKMLPLAPAGRAPASRRTWSPKALLADWIATRNSPHTQLSYQRDIDSLGEFLETDAATAAGMLLEGKAQAEMVTEHWDRWLRDVRDASPATRARRIWSVQSLVKHARRRGVVDFAIETPAPKIIPRRDTAGPDPKAIDGLLVDLATSDHPTAARDAALVACLYVLALRHSEVMTMRVSDCDVDRKRLRIVQKGRLGLVPARSADGTLVDHDAIEPDRERLEGVPDSVWRLLDAHMRWLRSRRPRITGSMPLWWRTDPAGRPVVVMRSNYLGRLIERLVTDAGLPRCVPHGLRHAGVTKLLDASNGNLRMAASYARHADLRQLARYDDKRRGLFGEAARLVADAIE
jgi:integrase/recombinase XerC